MSCPTRKPYAHESLHVEFYRKISTSDDLAFYKSELEHFRGLADIKVLELGCGDGRILETLASLGICAVGIDNSQAMLEKCKTMQGIRLQVGDMRNFSLAERFDIIILGFRTFHMFTEDSEQETCFKSVAGHLKKTGSFLLHLMHPNPELIKSPPSDKLVELDGATLTRKTLKFDVDMQSQKHMSEVVFELRKKGHDQPERKEVELLHSRWIWPDQLYSLAQRTGLQVVGFSALGGDRIYRLKLL